MRRVAIFDIDGTIFRSSLLIETTNALIAEGIFPARARRMYQRSFENWLNRKGEYGDYIADVVRVFDQYIRGVQKVTFLRVVRKVMAYQKHRVYRFTRDTIRQLRKRGFYLIAISHSPRDLVVEFTKHWGFDRVYGRMFELDARQRFTGKVLHVDVINDKANIVKHAIAHEGLSLKGSVGVGDSEGDISMLKLVERPICFNPNGLLYKHAKRAGWEVVVERKDVVYHLS
jgi:HAD superfamily hydrolase (TIGR01490 family)